MNPRTMECCIRGPAFCLVIFFNQTKACDPIYHHLFGLQTRNVSDNKRKESARPLVFSQDIPFNSLNRHFGETRPFFIEVFFSFADILSSGSHSKTKPKKKTCCSWVLSFFFPVVARCNWLPRFLQQLFFLSFLCKKRQKIFGVH